MEISMLDLYEVEQNEEELTGLTYEEISAMARNAILTFFSDKRTVDGKELNPQELLSKESVDLVVNTTIIDGVDRVYDVIWDTRLSAKEDVIAILTDCAKRWIPKGFAAGIMIMYFRLCEGLPIG